ncbi:MAG: hypothetical protein IE909_02930 [Campylobacterales bacterium]|nr:hypothetical protein [Campylobacterales bacterium]
MLSSRSKLFLLSIVIITGVYFALDYYKEILTSQLKEKIFNNEIANIEYQYEKLLVQQKLELLNTRKIFSENYDLAKIITTKSVPIISNTFLKDSFLTLLDKNLEVVYTNIPIEHRSLQNKKSLSEIFDYVIEEKVFYYANDVGFFLTNIYPIKNGNSVIGYLQIQKHFDLLAQTLSNNFNYFIVLLNEKDSLLIDVNLAYSKYFIDKRYVANKDANDFYLKVLEQLENKVVDKFYFNNEFIVLKNDIYQNGSSLATAYIIRSVDDIDISIINSSLILINILTVVLILLIGFGFFYLGELSYIRQFRIENQELLEENEKLKVLADQLDYNEKKLSNLFNLQPNVMFISNGVDIVQVNKRFMGFFRKYGSLENFKNKHRDISDLFEQTQEPNYVTGYLIDQTYWLEYILENPKKLYKTIMSVDGDPHHFIIKVNEMQYMQNFKERYIVVAFVDFTQEYNNKQINTPTQEAQKEIDLTYIIEDSISLVLNEMTNILPTRNAIVKATEHDFFDKQLVQSSLSINSQGKKLVWDVILPVESVSVICNFINQDWDGSIEFNFNDEIKHTAQGFIENICYNLEATLNLYDFQELQDIKIEATSCEKILSSEIVMDSYYRFMCTLEATQVEIFIKIDQNSIPYLRQLVMLGMLF